MIQDAERAVVVLNEYTHNGYVTWRVVGGVNVTPYVDSGEPEYYHLSEFEAVAIAEKYLSLPIDERQS